MTGFYRNFIRPVLFSQDSEAIHNTTIGGLAFCSKRQLFTDAVASFFAANELPTELFGWKFPNPVGLAAGMDKFAAAVPAWEAMGFGFTELGGVTRLEQPGNPAPRMFRVVDDRALASPRSVQIQQCQGFCAMSRTMNFQWIRSPYSVDSTLERRRVFQIVVYWQCCPLVL